MRNATRHARVRSQQRGLPPLILDLLKRFGRRAYDHRGAVRLYFDKKARRRVAQEIGRMTVARLHEFWNAFAVLDADHGILITCGHQYRKISRC